MRTAGSRLGPVDRLEALRRLTEQEFDIIVVGGGVTGAGTALDAASRGLSVALLEARDLAIGTSSRSGKTFHGGLRYLEQLNFSLVRQAAHERNLMVDRLCPHLTRPTPFLFPLTRRVVERPYVGAGVLLYDLLGGARRTMPRHRHLTKTGALRELPALRPGRITGALQYYDAIFDDARHTMTVARTAARFGAQVATYLEVTGVLRAADRVIGVRASDHETGQEIDVRGRCVVSATGVWADHLQELAGKANVEVRPAKGVHIVVPRDRIRSQTGLIARTADSVLVIRPWGQFWLIGTTDTPWDHGRDDPAANSSDVDYLLEQVNSWLEPAISRDDIVGVYAGLRPLLKGDAESSAALSRDHAVLAGPDGMLTVVGGKYTTYRVMAEDAVDAAAKWLDRPPAPSCTQDTPLIGADGWAVLRHQVGRLSQESGLPPELIERLLGRYGSLVDDLFELIAGRPELAEPIGGAPPYLQVEAVYAASHEGARHLDDVLVRRTHIAMETPDRGLAAAAQVAALVGDVLGWDEQTRRDEVSRYAAQIDADLRAEAVPTDNPGHGN